MGEEVELSQCVDEEIERVRVKNRCRRGQIGVVSKDTGVAIEIVSRDTGVAIEIVSRDTGVGIARVVASLKERQKVSWTKELISSTYSVGSVSIGRSRMTREDVLSIGSELQVRGW